MAGLGIIFLAANALAVEAPPAGAPAWFTSQKWVQILVVVPLFLCAWLAGNGFWFKDSGKVVEKGLVTPEVGLWAIKVSAVVTCFWFVAWILHLLVTRRTGQASRSSWGVLLVTAPFAGALYGILDFVAIFAFVAIRRRFFPGDVGQEWSLIHVTVLGAPAFVGIVLLGGVLHIGLMGRNCVDASREWWNRLGGWLIIYCITWLGISAMAFYVPVLVLWIGGFAASVLSAGWLVTSVGGLLFDRLSADDGPLSESKLAGVVRAVLPQFFVVGLLAVLAFALHAIIDGGYSARQIETVQKGDAVPVANVCRDFWPAGEVEGERNPAASFPNLLMCHSARTWLSLENRPLTGLLFLALGFGSLLLSWRVDINQFSMHYFYRNRLIRAYLGASNPRRRPQSFTGFDPEDDFPMADLLPDGPTRYDGPLHLVNANLNLVQGAELAWQQRKGASFVFTPLSTGFAGAADTPVSQTGFRPTREYKTQGGGISLGMAMAISGAAVSPSMGQGTTAAMSFLLTVFDARLGWWLGNPLKEAPIWKRIGPDVGLFRLLAELFGATNDRSNYVYLSDGGHFDNLGIYELVRRRCRLIVASDGGADTDRTFGCLANAIRKCRNDFGVPITIDLSGFRFGEAHRFSDVHCAVGRIHYDAVDPDAPEGTLLFLKATLTGDEPADVLNYKAAHPDFPNQSTTDQFFDEAQFESYRALGYHTAKSVFRHLDTSELSDLGHAELCDALEHAFCQDEDEHDEEARKTVG